MQLSDPGEQLQEIITHNVSSETKKWIEEKLDRVISSTSARELYLSYSLLAGKIDNTKPLNVFDCDSEIAVFLGDRKANTLQVSRIYLLVRVLEENAEYFIPKVANLIQVADTRELETFLTYLFLLPRAEAFKNVAVEALRTNIATVFDAISLNNPYPAKYFNDQQWNQMYLKAAFMQRNLAEIEGVDSRANKDLTRIISDYAHERWAASRDVDPLFWRPVSDFLEGELLDDMQRLLKSSDLCENRAAALCCYYSKLTAPRKLLENYPALQEDVARKRVTWENLIN